MRSFFAWLGAHALGLFQRLGLFVLFFSHSFSGFFRGVWSRRELLEQMERIGVGSVFMVSVTSAFVGMVMAVQTLDQFVRFGATSFIGGVLALSLVREMSPVLTGLVVTGRVGAAMAAEISSMKVTEQLDALRAFGLDDVTFVGVPRFLASLLMLPLLTVYSFVIGISGGFLYVYAHGISPQMFRRSIEVLLEPADLFGGVLKGALFGAIIAVTACSEGFHAETGARGVGAATTQAVIWGNMLILIFNYILSAFLFGGS
ncbi:ABC transporter permease [Aminithiophilus ramosus]|uniref:ABC transporter permease n=2 Tax=Synergistales TaxID=649776 RepID=A0A9Q7ARY1_9BACT|nr:ABC transporter permease [Aminithiophilus ramosus]QTX32901.1 ABC transporter permease [Aminithiophilus ramosus]QVL37334.1 ABC transporter permease [Synergistota bacterium]